MIRRSLTLAPLALSLVLGACDRSDVTAPARPALDETRAGSPALDILTYNVYYGAPIQELAQVTDPTLIPFKAAELFGIVQATDFRERAGAIADQIERVRPHLIGLQEVTLYRMQSPGDFLAGNPQPAQTVVFDYLDILSDTLAARGLSYVAAAQVLTFDVEVPIVNFQTGGLDDIRLTEFGVILVRGDVEWSNPQSGTFAAVLPIEVGGFTIPKPSGWVSVDVTVKGLPYRFVNTHLEPADVAPGVVIPQLAALQAAQLAELLGVVDASPMPLVLVGDFNSDDDGSTTATYETIRDEGFLDAWLVGPPRERGFTANQAPDLTNAVSQLFHRVDYIFYRDAFTIATDRFPGAVVYAERVGEEQGDRTASGLWPSDHAGVAASLVVTPDAGAAF